MINIIKSGAINEVKNDYLRHKRNFSQMRMKIGFCCIFDGDYKDDPMYSNFHNNVNEFTFFLFPYVAPEKFLIQAYLTANPNSRLQSAFNNIDHHYLFQEMVEVGLASDTYAARGFCWDAFKATSEYITLKQNLTIFLFDTVKHFSKLSD